MIKNIYRNLCRKLNRFHTYEEGAVLIEFAFALPVLLLLFIGGEEVARALIISQRLQNTTTSVADATAQIDSRNLPVANFASANGTTGALGYMDTVFQSSSSMSGMYGKDAYEIIVFDFSYPIGGTAIQANWDCFTRGVMRSTNSFYHSRLQIAGTAIQFTDGNGNVTHSMTLNPGDEIITAEGFYNYSPIIQNFVPMSSYTFYNTAVYPLRFSATLANYMASLPRVYGTYVECEPAG